MGGTCSRLDEDDVILQQQYQQQQQQQRQQQQHHHQNNHNKFHAEPTVVTDMPVSPSSPQSSPTKNSKSSTSRFAASNLFRVGSTIPSRAPDSPAHRASDYNHVHETVALNFEMAEYERRDRWNRRWKRKRRLRKSKMNNNNTNNNTNNANNNHHLHNNNNVNANSSLMTSSTIVAMGKAMMPPLGVVGLRNMGNTCYLNSSLQCLSATIPLTDYFLAYNFRSEINKENVLGTGGKLATAYANLIKSMWLGMNQSSTGSNTALTPSAFKHQLDKFSPQFVGTAQQDSQELLSFLLDGIHEDLNRIKPKKPYIEDSDCDGTHDEHDAIVAWRNYLRRDKSVIVDIFQGQLRNSLQCLVCGHCNIRFEPFMYLSLPLTDKCRTLQDCLDEYCRVEYLRGENQWYCSHCKRHVDATKKTDLWILPPILIVHLKRFRFNEYGHMAFKNEARVQYPIQNWDLQRRVKSRAQRHDVNLSYDLYAVSNHFGGRLGSGHYTAYCLNRFDEEWYQFNDSSTSRVDEATLRQNQAAAYLLFYNRSNTNSNSVHGGTTSANSSEGSGTLNDHSSNTLTTVSDRAAPLIRRQSVSRPDLWPHTQVQDVHSFRNFRRSSMQRGRSDLMISSIQDPPGVSL